MLVSVSYILLFVLVFVTFIVLVFREQPQIGRMPHNTNHLYVRGVGHLFFLVT